MKNSTVPKFETMARNVLYHAAGAEAPPAAHLRIQCNRRGSECGQRQVRGSGCVAISMCAAFSNRKELRARAVIYHLSSLTCPLLPCLGFLSCMDSRARHSLLTRVSQQGRRAVVAAFHGFVSSTPAIEKGCSLSMMSYTPNFPLLVPS